MMARIILQSEVPISVKEAKKFGAMLGKYAVEAYGIQVWHCALNKKTGKEYWTRDNPTAGVIQDAAGASMGGMVGGTVTSTVAAPVIVPLILALGPFVWAVLGGLWAAAAGSLKMLHWQRENMPHVSTDFDDILFSEIRFRLRNVSDQRRMWVYYLMGRYVAGYMPATSLRKAGEGEGRSFQSGVQSWDKHGKMPDPWSSTRKPASKKTESRISKSIRREIKNLTR